jgi:hypothetical protein
MLEFLYFTSVKLVIKFLLLFFGIATVPLYFIFWLKKRRQPSAVALLLNKCIKHGQTLRSEECKNIYGYLLEIKANLESFAQNAPAPSQARVSLAQAVELLPLIYEISLPHTCCEQLGDGLNYDRGVDCKSSLRDLLENLRKVADLPLVADELERITRAKQKMQKRKRRRKPLLLLVFAAYFCTSFFLSQKVLLIRNSWMIELGVYLGCLLILLKNYDYYFSKELKRYQSAWKR